MLNNNTILLIIIIININSFLIGYLFGHYRVKSGVSNNTTSFFNQQKEVGKKTSVTIDDAKFVVDIKTEGLEKKYDSLGDKKTTEDNISESVNKLKNLRGKS